MEYPGSTHHPLTPTNQTTSPKDHIRGEGTRIISHPAGPPAGSAPACVSSLSESRTIPWYYGSGSVISNIFAPPRQYWISAPSATRVTVCVLLATIPDRKSTRLNSSHA